MRASALALALLACGQGSSRPDAEPLTVQLLQPTDGQTVSGVVAIRVAAHGGAAIEQIDLTASDLPLAELTAEPYELDWDASTMPDGPYTLKAVAHDVWGGQAEDSVSITILCGQCTVRLRLASSVGS